MRGRIRQHSVLSMFHHHLTQNLWLLASIFTKIIESPFPKVTCNLWVTVKPVVFPWPHSNIFSPPNCQNIPFPGLFFLWVFHSYLLLQHCFLGLHHVLNIIHIHCFQYPFSMNHSLSPDWLSSRRQDCHDTLAQGASHSSPSWFSPGASHFYEQRDHPTFPHSLDLLPPSPSHIVPDTGS